MLIVLSFKILMILPVPLSFAKECKISLESDEPLFHLGSVILSRLERLEGFEKLVLRVWTKWTGEAQTISIPRRHKEQPKGFLRKDKLAIR